MNAGSPALAYLAESSVRAACLAVPAVAALWLGRKRPACWRHAVLTVLLGAMLLLPALLLALPKVPLRVLRAAAAVPTATFAPQPAGGQQTSGPAQAISPPREGQAWPGWRQIAVAAYLTGAFVFLARLLAGYWFVRRLVKASV